MDSALLILTLVLCVAASAVLVRAARLPLPLTQVALGALVGLPPLRFHVELEPELFMLLFVPPLLFADGWRMPKREFFEMRDRIIGLAFGLVLATVLAVGYLLHWLIPQLPLAAAFALAAVLSPTDAVAISALAGRAGMPKRLAYLLQGEALMNDASGLATFKFAVAATMTGLFSLQQASLSLLWIAGGGLGVGMLFGWGMATFQKWLSGWTRVETQGVIVLTLLLPFSAYLVAEALEVSGILAAVAAGMTLNLRGAAVDSEAEARIASRHIWTMIEYLLNGIVFVLLGLQLPDIVLAALRDMWKLAGISGVTQLLGYVAVVAGALFGVRLLWVILSVRTTRLYARLRGSSGPTMPRKRLVLVGAVAGVRGAVTLAAVLSLPLRLPDGSPFPLRDLIIFLATSVILVSLLVAAIGLPLLLRGLVVESDPEADEEQRARARACEAAIAAVTGAASRAEGSHDALSDSAARVVDAYRERLEGLAVPGEDSLTPERLRQQRALRLLGLRAERSEVLRLHRSDEINDTVLNALLYEIDVREEALVLKGRNGHGL